jgi:thioredoxin 1
VTIGSVILAFVAGVLSILSLCVLPILPIVLGAAASEHKWGPVALATGLALSFVVIGLFVATVGDSIGLNPDLFRYAAATLVVSCAGFPAAFAAGPQAFDDKRFAEAQAAGKPILIAIHASWCPTCKAQKPIISELLADPKFKYLLYFIVDFDSQKNLVTRFGARMQSTLIAFKGEKEGRSVGDTNPASIAALLNKTL